MGAFRSTAALLGMALCLPGTAHGEGRFTDPGPQPPLPPCTCRADGRSFQLGETTCLRTPEGGRIARCVMVINNTSWQTGSQPCPTAALPPPEAGRS